MRALERFVLKMQDAAKEQNFDTEEEAELWLQEQLFSDDLESYAAVPTTELEKAQDLAWKAFEEPSEKKRISMAKKALQISADCADAYVILAEEHVEDNRSEAEALYRKGIEAGRRALGDTAIAHLEKDFWNDYETRPFMRAVSGLASLLQDFGAGNEAIELWYELLRLDPSDGQENHLRLVPGLVGVERYEEAKELIDRYKLQPAPALAYSLALMLFKQSGDSVEANNALLNAMEMNGSVIHRLLTPTHNLPFGDAEYSDEEEAEAESYAMYAYVDWADAEGALDWIFDRVEAGLEKQVQRTTLTNTFPGLKIAGSEPDMLQILGSLNQD